MALFLNIPQKHELKKLGAHRNIWTKKWSVSDRCQYVQFAKWLDGDLIVTDRIYIVEGFRVCYRCRKKTSVIGFGIDSYFYASGRECEPYVGDIHICTIDSAIPSTLAAQLEQRYDFKKSYSKSAQTTDYGNHCKHCHALQGNYYIYEDEDSPFFIDGAEKAKKLVLHKIDLPYDIAVSASIGYGSEDHLIRQYAKFVNSDLKWK